MIYDDSKYYGNNKLFWSDMTARTQKKDDSMIDQSKLSRQIGNGVFAPTTSSGNFTTPLDYGLNSISTGIKPPTSKIDGFLSTIDDYISATDLIKTIEKINKADNTTTDLSNISEMEIKLTPSIAINESTAAFLKMLIIKDVNYDPVMFETLGKNEAERIMAYIVFMAQKMSEAKKTSDDNLGVLEFFRK